MADEKKKPVLGLLAALKPAKPTEPEEGLDASPLRNATQGVMDAFKSGDVSALEDALKTFMDANGSRPVDDF